MSEPLQCCPHDDAEGCAGACDCGREVSACYECLAAGKVLSCGQCGISEATNIGEGSLKLARDFAALQLASQDLGGSIQDKETEIRFLKQREDNQGEEWKN